jgi:hypothetical protein
MQLSEFEDFRRQSFRTETEQEQQRFTRNRSSSNLADGYRALFPWLPSCDHERTELRRESFRGKVENQKPPFVREFDRVLALVAYRCSPGYPFGDFFRCAQFRRKGESEDGQVPIESFCQRCGPRDDPAVRFAELDDVVGVVQPQRQPSDLLYGRGRSSAMQ